MNISCTRRLNSRVYLRKNWRIVDLRMVNGDFEQWSENWSDRHAAGPNTSEFFLFNF